VNREREMRLATRVALALASGAAVNVPWELAQASLYRHEGVTASAPMLACTVAAVLDGVAIAVLYLIVSALLREPGWPSRMTLSRLGIIVGLGGGGAILLELLAIRLGWWRYTESMPLLPLTKVSLTPVLQFVLLPPLVLFGIVGRRIKRGPQGRKAPAKR
jgi:hypothetical protein